MIEFLVVLNTSYVYWDINILHFAFPEKFPGRCSVDVKQYSKYCKKTFRSHENRGLSTLENGRSDGLSSNLGEVLSLIFIILKNISIKEQNFGGQRRVVHISTKLYQQWKLMQLV